MHRNALDDLDACMGALGALGQLTGDAKARAAAAQIPTPAMVTHAAHAALCCAQTWTSVATPFGSDRSASTDAWRSCPLCVATMTRNSRSWTGS
jgi:hypothetical protein